MCQTGGQGYGAQSSTIAERAALHFGNAIGNDNGLQTGGLESALSDLFQSLRKLDGGEFIAIVENPGVDGLQGAGQGHGSQILAAVEGVDQRLNTFGDHNAGDVLISVKNITQTFNGIAAQHSGDLDFCVRAVIVVDLNKTGVVVAVEDVVLELVQEGFLRTAGSTDAVCKAMIHINDLRASLVAAFCGTGVDDGTGRGAAGSYGLSALVPAMVTEDLPGIVITAVDTGVVFLHRGNAGGVAHGSTFIIVGHG